MLCQHQSRENQNQHLRDRQDLISEEFHVCKISESAQAKSSIQPQVFPSLLDTSVSSLPGAYDAPLHANGGDCCSMLDRRLASGSAPANQLRLLLVFSCAERHTVVSQVASQRGCEVLWTVSWRQSGRKLAVSKMKWSWQDLAAAKEALAAAKEAKNGEQEKTLFDMLLSLNNQLLSLNNRLSGLQEEKNILLRSQAPRASLI
ncbi:hypothetical protein ABBQ32_002245 [Trebouxia sp. C0010 RCD-2024]